MLAQLPEVAPDSVLAEPSPRDSMAAIGLAAALLERSDPDAVMGSFAADHVIADPDLFADAVRAAVDVARDDWLVTLGHRADLPFRGVRLHPSRRRGSPAHPAAAVVEAFVEKPSVATAEGYLATGDYRWNAGMFVVRPTVLLDLLGTWHPEFAADLRTIAADPSRLEELWPTLPKIALDHAIAEPAADAGRVAVVPAEPSAGRTSATSTRSPRCSEGSTTPARARRHHDRARDRCHAGWWCPAPAGSSRWSGSTTSWSSTPRTRCW